MRVLRSSLFVAATAIIAAACGDKVNIVQPGGTAGKINSVQVAPSSATISVGQTVTLTAAVNADVGITTSVAWSSSSAAATVTQGGISTVVAGVASSPGVAICATASATGVASVVSCGTVVVSPANQVVPAVIQIASITVAGNLNAPVPVPPGVVVGQINVSVNVNPGTEKMDSVVVLVNNIPAATQIFTSGQAAALRFAADAADQALQSTLVFSINTAAYATAGCATFVAPCGTPTFANGPAAISVVGYGHQGASAAVNTTSSSVNLLFGNADAWLVTQSYGAGTNGISPIVTSAAGFNYVGGPTASVTVQAVPVNYSGLTIASANVNFGTAACDASGNAQRVAAMVTPAAGLRDWTATFARTAAGAAGVTNVNNYEFNAAVCVAANAAGGEGAAIANALYTTNTTAPVGIALGSVAPVVRLDDRAPGVPSLVQNPRVRQNGWLNGAVSMTTYKTAATQERVLVQGVADAGVGGDAGWVRAAAPDAGGTVAPANAATAATGVTAGTGVFAPTLTNSSLCAVFTSRDALGNESALPAAATLCSPVAVGTNTVLAANNMLLGIDIAPPTIAIAAGSIAASTAGVGSTGASVGGEFQFSVLDTGTIGNAGMLATGPVIGTVILRTATTATAAQTCVAGTLASGVCTVSATGFGTVAFPLVSTSVVAAQTIIGYYTVSAQAIDAAGNVSTNTITRVRSYNPAANVPALTGSLFGTPLNGPTATFTATGSSGTSTSPASATALFDLWKVSYNLAYAGGLAGPLVYPSTTLQPFNTAPFLNTNVPVTITINGFIRQVEASTNACNAALTTGGAFKPNALNEALLDQVSNSSGNVATPIAGGSVTAGVSYLAVVPATQQTFSYIVANGTVEQPTVGGCPIAAGAVTVVRVSGGGTSPDAASVTLNADVWGPTATFNPPFSQVNFYVKVGANLELIGTTNAFVTTDDGSAQGRKHRFSFAWTPGAASPISATAWPAQSSAGAGCTTATIPFANNNIYAVGVSATGDALVTPVAANICISTAP